MLKPPSIEKLEDDAKQAAVGGFVSLPRKEVASETSTSCRVETKEPISFSASKESLEGEAHVCIYAE